jgi:hypothetical protein
MNLLRPSNSNNPRSCSCSCSCARVRVVATFVYFYLLSQVSAYPNPQTTPPTVPKLNSQSFGLVPGSESTQPPLKTVQLALTTLSTRSSILSSTFESSTPIPASTFHPLSFPSFPSSSSSPAGDAVPATTLSLSLTISVASTFYLLDSLYEPDATPVSAPATSLAPQPSEQVPLGSPLGYATASIPTQLPHPSSDAWILSPQPSTTSVNHSFVIGMVFASMFAFTVVCLLILQCSRWYHAKRTSLSSSDLTQSGSFSTSAAMEKRKWVRGTLFDVEIGMVENLAGVGRAACE